MRVTLFICCFIIGILIVHSETTNDAKSAASAAIPTSASTLSEVTSLTSTLASAPTTDETAKDKRQVGAKDEAVYANHRSDTADADDPENPQETIYGPKPTQFIIRPIAPHEHQQHEDHQPPQLRNYPATIRPHSTQLLEQSQEIQHFAYLQDINRNRPKSTSAATELTGKTHSAQQSKKGFKSGRAHAPASQYRGNAEEAEQQYAIAIQPPNPTAAQAPHYGAPPQQIAPRYHIAVPVQQQQQLAPAGQPSAPQQPYQIIPEEEFLRLLEDELRARAFHEAQYRQQQQQQQTAPAPLPTKPLPHPTERIGQGLGSYRQQAQLQPQSLAEEPTPQYVQYVPRHRSGPKYLPQPQPQLQPQQVEPQAAEPAAEAPTHIPPQLAYYQPQVSYKTLPNHPLAKSSLENEIEKLLAANKPSPIQLTDNSNEPSAVVHQHHQPPQQQLPPHPIPRPRQYAVQQKIYSSPSNSQPTPTPLVDANNQPFIPSLFRFSNLQQPTPIYPTQVPQHVVDSKKLGPVIYPPTQAPTPAQQSQQPTQYFYQELTPTARPKTHRSNKYGSKVSTSSPKLREKEPPNYPNVPAAAKYLNPHLYYDYDRQPSGQSSPAQFHPSPPDPNTPTAEQQQQPQLQHQQQVQAHHYSAPAPAPPPQTHSGRQYISPPPAPSQSSIFVAQGTGIATPSRSNAVKTKSIEDVRQLHLPQPGGKPLTQSEFQALIDAGYPVTAVPVPIPVPYEQYIKEHPEFRNQPVDYAQLMQRIAQQYGPRRLLQAQPSEPSANVASAMADAQTATAIGGGNITYLRPVAEQKRHPRDEAETAVAGNTDEAKQ
ncbi:bromodomain-containing protein 4-like [Rhagoletis pomonella]|uniref:bromodomain-containing protein 4-like n=1 Tax=Rhagoletis pomonella TaxID=28610 RepID=UPI0017818BB2|nr:bromodomain-containing protein 4-like [Rhagoletis pomonella]